MRMLVVAAALGLMAIPLTARAEGASCAAKANFANKRLADAVG